MNQFNKIPISKIMSSKVITFPQDAAVIDLVDQFKAKKMHHAPVVDKKGEVVGMLSVRDIESYYNIVQIISAEDRPVAVKDVMTSPIFSYFESVTVKAAADAMLDNHINAIVVMSEPDEKMVGILTSTDILAFVAGHKP